MSDAVLNTTDLANLRKMGILSLEDTSFREKDPAIHQLRRAMRKSTLASKTRVLTIVEDPETGARFCYESFGVLPYSDSAMRRGIPFFGGKIVHRLTYEEVGPNQITSHLVNFDDSLTPGPGLKRLKTWDTDEAQREIVNVSQPAYDKPAVLLIVHGTFSNTKNVLNEIAKTAEGNTFIQEALKDHEVLLFDHRTISVSPVLNALDLARAFANCSTPVRVVAHSRGGLVARWWLESFDQPNGHERKVVLVGCPLEGTSLAAPKNLRNGLDLLANIEKLAGDAASLIPWGTVVAGLFKALSIVTSIAAKTPAIDAAIAMIPGIYAMSRMGEDNAELLRLNQDRTGSWPKYYGVQSNFRPEDVGLKIWRLFNKDHIADVIADRLVFPEDNDLVVDTRSMKRLMGSSAMEDCYNFADEPAAKKRGGAAVHHTNYFRQPETIARIRQYLAI